jgi:hypothetical protein
VKSCFSKPFSRDDAVKMNSERFPDLSLQDDPRVDVSFVDPVLLAVDTLDLALFDLACY